MSANLPAATAAAVTAMLLYCATADDQMEITNPAFLLCEHRHALVEDLHSKRHDVDSCFTADCT